MEKTSDSSAIAIWQQSIGFYFVEVAFHSHHMAKEHNISICRALLELDEIVKFNLTTTLNNNVPFCKPDSDYHYCNSTLEIEECIADKHASFLLLLDSIIPDHYVKIKKIHKILHKDSTLIGHPFPEKCFIRLRVDLICAVGKLRESSPKP